MYKNYNMTQLTLPMETSVLIPTNDISRHVNDIVETIPDNEFDEFRHHRGATSYHPKMMLKVILYAYTQSVFSGRKIEKMLNDSIRMMWLSQNQKPSYKTINRFRVNPKVDALLESLFIQFYSQCVKQNLIDDKAIFIDGTKIEANANRYTFVWKKSIQNHESKMNEDSKALYHELVTNKIIPEIKKDHDNELTKEEIDLIGSHLDKEIEDLNQHINNEKCTKTRKQIRLKRTKIKKYKKQINDYFERKYRYEFQKSILKDRNSYSKTDHDATFMRMKEDHMKNGQLKPGYNLQIATNSQFVLSYNVYQNPTDTRTMIPFLNSIQETYGHLPEYIVADAGYGSESNYKAIIDDFNRTPLITYGMFIKDKTKKYKSDIFNTQNWNYDEINDEFICPNNKRLGFKRYAYRHDKYGYKRDFKLYECDDCSECPLKNQCMNFNSKTNKKIMKNYNWEYFKSQINKKLSEPETKNIYSQRKIDVEPVFGFMKAILGFTRMSVRGLNKVKRELGFVLMALNIRKVVAQRAENNQKIYKKDNFYIISIEIVFFSLIQELYVPDSLSILFGDAKIDIPTIIDAIFNYNPKNQQHNVISEIRIPRDLGAILVGMALSVAGAVIQGVTKNSLADPSLIGLNSGASFGLAITYAFYPEAPFTLLMVAGFLGALLGGSIVLMIGRSRKDGFNPMRIILAGAAVSAMLTALSQGVALIFRLNQSLTFWSAGGVSGTTWPQIIWTGPIIIVTLVVILAMSRQLTILNLGESLAKGLGQNVTMIRVVILVLAMVLAGVAVSMVGQIAFVGLMVPHIVRFIIGTDYSKVLPLTAILGGILMLVADMLARYLGDAPVGAIISFIGVPYFLYLVKKGGRSI